MNYDSKFDYHIFSAEKIWFWHKHFECCDDNVKFRRIAQLFGLDPRALILRSFVDTSVPWARRIWDAYRETAQLLETDRIFRFQISNSTEPREARQWDEDLNSSNNAADTLRIQWTVINRQHYMKSRHGNKPEWSMIKPENHENCQLSNKVKVSMELHTFPSPIYIID